MYLRPPLMFALALVAAVSADLLPADDTSDRSVVAVGEETIEKSPEQLIIAVDLIGRSRDLGQAGQILKDRIEAAKSQAIAFGASPTSIRIGRAQLASDQSAVMNELSESVRDGYIDAGEEEAAANIQPLATLTATFVAAFELTSDNSIAQLQQYDQLVRKLKAAELSGANDMTGLSPEDEELVAEAMLLSVDEYSDEEPLGTPAFYFGATLTEAEVTEATKRAYESARKNASQLATAAGVEISGLLSLRNTSDQSSSGYEYGYHSGGDMMETARSLLEAAVDEGELLISYDAGGLTSTISVTATFAFIEP